MRSFLFLLKFSVVYLFVLTYAYLGLKAILRKYKYKKIILRGYIILSILEVLTFCTLMMVRGVPISTWRSVLLFTVVGLFFARLVMAVFLLVDDVRRGIQWIVQKLFLRKQVVPLDEENDKLSRSQFLTWLGVAAGGTLFGSLTYGMSNRYNYQVRRETFYFPDLPKAFDDWKIVHISDIHSGSLHNKYGVMRGVNMILAENPDIILFTGDSVNDRATELESLKDVLGQLKAPFGVYSVLGNHDYGDYVEWPYQGVTQKENLDHLVRTQTEMGWRVLMDEHVVIEKEGEQLAILGVQNWSNKRNFKVYGDLQKAYQGSAQIPFKILMSHDPSHWDGEVLPNYKDIHLTLSGHTHGMQFGVELPNFKWSPAQYVYKQWAGTYASGNQKLYVNRGFGFIGYPGRVGILPEITVIELKKG